MSHVWRHLPYKGADLLLMVALADFADDDGNCFPRFSTLAEKARMSVKSVQRAVIQAEKDGYVAVERGSRGGPTRFRIVIENLPSQVVFSGKNKGKKTPVPQDILSSGTENTTGQIVHCHRTICPVPQDILSSAIRKNRQLTVNEPSMPSPTATVAAQAPPSLGETSLLFGEREAAGSTESMGVMESNSTPLPPSGDDESVILKNDESVMKVALAHKAGSGEAWRGYGALLRRNETPAEPEPEDGKPWTPWQQFCLLWREFRQINTVNAGSKKLAWKRYVKLRPTYDEAGAILDRIAANAAPGGAWHGNLSPDRQCYVGHFSSFLSAESWRND